MKRKFILGALSLAACFSIFGLAACDSSSDGDEFEENVDPEVEKPAMYVVGGIAVDGNWTPAKVVENTANAFTLDATSEGLNTKLTYTVTLTESQVPVEFKFIGDGSWNNQYGLEDVDFEASNEAFLISVGDLNSDGEYNKEDKYSKQGSTSNRTNIAVTDPGTYVIDYYPYNFASEEVNGTTYSSKFVITATTTHIDRENMEHTYAVIGNAWGSWSTETISATTDYNLTLVEGTSDENEEYKITMTVTDDDLTAQGGNIQFKIITDANWSNTSYGFSNVDEASQSYVSSIDGNIGISTAGTYVISFFPNKTSGQVSIAYTA